MEVKEKSNRITSNSTFKPPPRVTLTEQKKEAWLRDLANPSVPLRRLSRTIPHGTRNRSLLEQCCNKSIPIPRAVWFARCVGANELRGLKRKGSSQAGPVTEAQWIQEWTDQVTEFIEKVIKECSSSSTASILPPTSPTATSSSGSPNPSTQSKGKPIPKSYHSPNTSISKVTSITPAQVPWKTKMEYMIRLSASLFSEDLLDKPLFLKWCVVHFQRCKLDELPVAILFLRLFWNDIVQSRLLSQSLALALLERFAELSSPNLVRHSIFASVRDKVCEYLQSFFLLSPDSFVFPSHWKEMGPVLSESLKSIDNEVAQQLLDLICIRNESLIVSDASSVRALRNPKYLIIDTLDKAQPPYNWALITQNIHSNKITEQDALTTAFEWATTINRTGTERVYVCSSLLTEWHTNQKWDISEAFLNFLDQIQNPDDYVMENLYDLVTEFLDRDWFHASTYFRRLISQGILFISRLRPSVKVKVKILANMPVQYSSSLENQQIMLLKGLKLYDENETLRRKEAKKIILSTLDFLMPEYKATTDYYELSQENAHALESLTRGGQQQLSVWILKTLNKRLSHGLEISVSQFAILQNVLEILRDYKCLYSLIETLVQQTTNGSLLYFMANTARDHLAIFAAIADVIQLVQLFVTQYKSVKVKSKMSKGLWDLTNFALSQLPESNTQLRAELELIVSPAGQSPLKDITTLSPMSDGVMEGTALNLELGELLQEQQLGSQDNIDIRSLPKLFTVVSQKFLDACKAPEKHEEVRKMVKILQHLRDLDVGIFTELLTKWIRDKVEPALYYDANTFTRVLVFLVIYECLSLEKAADIFLQLLSVKLPGSTQGTKLMLRLISEDYLDGIQLKASEKLALNMQRRQFERSQSATYLKYIYQDILDSTETGSAEVLPESVNQFILWMASSDINTLIAKLVDPIIATENSLAVNSLRFIFGQLLKLDSAGGNVEAKTDILHLLEIFNHLNLTLCQVYIRVLMVCQGHVLKSNGEQDVEEILVNTLVEVISCAQSQKLSERALGDFMIYLPSELKHRLLITCELMFIRSSHFPIVVNTTDSASTSGNNILVYLLEVVDAIADAVEQNLLESNAFEVTESLDKLAQACEQYVQPGPNAEEDAVMAEDSEETTAAIATPGVSEKDVRPAILMFVKILMINSASLLGSKGYESLRDKLSSGLVRILGTQFVTSNSDMYGLVMDTLSTIKQDFSDTSSTGATNAGSSSVGSGSAAAGTSSSTEEHRRPVSGSSTGPVVSPSVVVTQGDNNVNSILSNISPAALAATASRYGKACWSERATSGAGDANHSTYLSDLIMYNKSSKKYSELNVRSFDLLEESNHTMQLNDVAVNLAIFDGFIEKKNPA